MIVFPGDDGKTCHGCQRWIIGEVAAFQLRDAAFRLHGQSSGGSVRPRPRCLARLRRRLDGFGLRDPKPVRIERIRLQQGKEVFRRGALVSSHGGRIKVRRPT